jgi:hypothetical protein
MWAYGPLHTSMAVRRRRPKVVTAAISPHLAGEPRHWLFARSQSRAYVSFACPRERVILNLGVVCDSLASAVVAALPSSRAAARIGTPRIELLAIQRQPHQRRSHARRSRLLMSRGGGRYGPPTRSGARVGSAHTFILDGAVPIFGDILSQVGLLEEGGVNATPRPHLSPRTSRSPPPWSP